MQEPLFTRLDISATTTPGTPEPGSAPADASDQEVVRLLRELVALQQRTAEQLGEIAGFLAHQQRQRVAELKAWKEANPELSRSCRQAAESLARVHTEFLGSIARDARDNAEDFAESEFALGEFIDRYGPRLAHFNGVLQLFSQLGGPAAPTNPQPGS
ncbi:MAG: hypothetical protein ACKOCW_13370 [Planctomycetaceae bacterium]